jgi:hypothetical protein
VSLVALDLFGFAYRQSVSGQLLKECDEVVTRLLKYILSIPAQDREQIINGVLPIKEFPKVNARGAQAKTMTRSSVEEHCPVVKLLPEYNERVGYRFFTLLVHLTVPVLHRLSKPWSNLKKQ